MVRYNGIGTTVYFVFFEGGGESPSFHKYLPYSLHKPTKAFLRCARRLRAFRKLLLNGLFRSDIIIDVVNARLLRLRLATLRL